MGAYMPMSTTVRHNKITMTISSAIIDLLRKKEAHALQEECSLVHWGSQRETKFSSLIDVKELDDADRFTKITINELDYVLPDFVLFKNNPHLCNERETRTAGCPDLIIEVWSEGNSKAEREFKLDLYSTSQVTEHWYIEQDSNEVICYLGNARIETQYLTDVLVTRAGIQFDLRYLAV